MQREGPVLDRAPEWNAQASHLHLAEHLGLITNFCTRPLDAPTSAERGFCHVYGRGRSADQFIPRWPYSFIAALEPGRSSWTALLDVQRLHPDDDVTAVTAAQLRALTGRLLAAGQHRPEDQDVLVVLDAGYDVARLAVLFSDLPVQLLGRLRSDRVLRGPGR